MPVANAKRNELKHFRFSVSPVRASGRADPPRRGRYCMNAAFVHLEHNAVLLELIMKIGPLPHAMEPVGVSLR